jgi:hypothetical protein
MTNETSIENLTHFAYTQFAEQYSKKNWFSNAPLWTDLSAEDQDFWKTFVTGIRTNFKPDTPKLSVAPAV